MTGSETETMAVSASETLLQGATATLQGLTGLSVIGSNSKGSAWQRLSLQLSIYLSWATGFSNISRPILNRSQSAGAASLVCTINKQPKPDTQDETEQENGDFKEWDDGAIKHLKNAGAASLVSTTNQVPKRDTQDDTEQESGLKEPKDGADGAETQRASPTTGEEIGRKRELEEERAAEARRRLEERQEAKNASQETARREREAENKREADARSAMRSSASMETQLGISAPPPTELTSDVESERRHQYWPPEQADLEQESQSISKQDGGAAKPAAIVNAIPVSEASQHDATHGRESYYEANEHHVHSLRPVSSNPSTGVPVQGSLEAAQVNHRLCANLCERT